ncbi:hypothetical protein GCM10027159_01460 [Lysobacter terrae]
MLAMPVAGRDSAMIRHNKDRAARLVQTFGTTVLQVGDWRVETGLSKTGVGNRNFVTVIITGWQSGGSQSVAESSVKRGMFSV